MTFASLSSSAPHTKTELSVWYIQMSAYLNVPEELLVEAIIQRSPGKTLGDFFAALKSGVVTEPTLRDWMNKTKLV